MRSQGSPIVTLELDWPPSVNHYLGTNGHRRFIKPTGQLYRWKVIARRPLGFEKLTGRLGLEIEAYPPDRRKRDLDNIFKCLLDSLQHAKIYENDNQIDEIWIRRNEVRKPGGVIVRIYAS